MRSMKNKRRFTKIIPLMVLVALLLSLVPLAGTACNSDNEEAPVAAFTGSPTTGSPPLEVQFTDKSTGEIDTWEWVFGDGETSTEQNPSHDYDIEGTYTVSLTITGPGGTDTATMNDYIEVGSFLAGFTADKTTDTFAAGGTVTIQFTDQSTSAGAITAWEWDFGDGETSTEQNPSHTYAGKVNEYTVSLTITSDEGTRTATKDDYILVLADEWQEMSLTMNNPHLETDPSGHAAEKFKELIELYTDGNVTVDIHHNGSLYDMSATFEALKTGAIDMATFNPGILQGINPNLAVVSALRGLVANAEHGRVVIADPAIKAILIDDFEEYNVRFLDYIEAYLLVGFFSPNTDLTDYTDFTGHTYWWGQPGKAAPIEEMFSPNTVYYTMEDVFSHMMNQDIDIVTLPPDMAYFYGLYNYFNYCLLTMTYSPNSVQMNLDTWNNMEPELQDLVNNVIMPNVQIYVQHEVVEAHKMALKTINEALDAVHFISPEREQEVWEMVQTQDDFLALKSTLDPELLALIENLRPATITMDQDVIDILTYANIPIPE